jgi:ubiquitin thioesterase ZRANB1
MEIVCVRLGVYLPLLWEPSFCWRWPIALGYTRGHFSALVPMEPDCDPIGRVDSAPNHHRSLALDAEELNGRCSSVYLPLTSVEGALLPIQFLTPAEVSIRIWNISYV